MKIIKVKIPKSFYIIFILFYFIYLYLHSKYFIKYLLFSYLFFILAKENNFIESNNENLDIFNYN